MYMIFIFYKIHYYSYLLKINIFTMSSPMDYVRKDFLTHVSPLQRPENTLFYTVSFTQTIVVQRRQKDACVNGRVLSSPSWVTPGRNLPCYTFPGSYNGEGFILGKLSSLSTKDLPLNFGSSIFTRHTYSLPTSPSWDAYFVFICHSCDRRHTSILAEWLWGTFWAYIL